MYTKSSTHTRETLRLEGNMHFDVFLLAGMQQAGKGKHTGRQINDKAGALALFGATTTPSTQIYIFSVILCICTISIE